MPTVIDSLILELGIDPKGFSSGAREASATIDDLTNKATDAGRTLEENTGRSLNRFLNGFDAHLKDVNANLKSILGSIQGL
jgi:hypothetical protein